MTPPWPGTPAHIDQLSAYVNAAYRVAAAGNYALLDITARWPGTGPVAAAPFSYSGDSLHISSRGHQDVAHALYNLLIGV